MPVYERLKTVIIENLDWQACFDRYNRSGALMYIDPPYPENGCNYVYNMRERADHEVLAAKLRQATCKWIVSSYDTDFIRGLFRDYTIISLESMSGMMTEKHGNTRVANKEVLILNYTPHEVHNETDLQIARKVRRLRKASLAQQNTLLGESVISD